MAQVIKLSPSEVSQLAEQSQCSAIERIHKDVLFASEQIRLASRYDYSHLSPDMSPLVSQLEKQMHTFQDDLAARIKDISFPQMDFPAAEIAPYFASSAVNELPSLLKDLREPREIGTLDFVPPLLEPVTPIAETIGDAFDESISELGERLEKRMQADASASQKQMIQVAGMINTLVAITMKSSQENAAATRKNLWLAIIMVIAAICQCLVPIGMHYWFK